MENAKFTVLLCSVATLALWACSTPHPSPPPSPAPPKACAKDACIALYTSGSNTNDCKTDLDPNNRGIYVQFPLSANLREPVTFLYERVQTTESNVVVERSTHYVTIDSTNSRKWLFCTQTRDAANNKRINWLSRLCATNRSGASTTDCATYAAKERWPIDDRWLPSFVSAEEKTSKKQAVKILDCPALCSSSTPLCRALKVDSGFDWGRYETARKLVSATKNYPLKPDDLDNVLGSDLAKSGRSDLIALVNSTVFQQGPELSSSYSAALNGKQVTASVKIPTLIQATYKLNANALVLDFENKANRAQLSFSDSGMSSLYGGGIAAVWLKESSVLFATEKRCVSVEK